MDNPDEFAEVLRDFLSNVPAPVLWGLMTAEEYQRKFGGVPSNFYDG